MKKIKIIPFLSLLLMFLNFTTCDDTLDINTDPLVATAADPNAVLPYVFIQYSARKVSELGTRMCDVSQYVSNTFNSPNLGDVPPFLTGNVWFMMYTQVLGNLSLVKADAELAGLTNNNVNAISTILIAHIFYEATSIWEDIPYSEALNGKEFPNPKFDDQETVLNGVVSMYDEAISLIDAIPSTGNYIIDQNSDMFYEGTMESWRVLANSLKLRALMMLKSGGANVDTQINTALGQPLMETNDQSAFINYSGGPGARNAFEGVVQQFFGGTNESRNIFGPGDPIITLLNVSDDPRLDLWVARNDLPAPGNDVSPDASTSVLSNNVIRADLPDMLMMPAEIDLYKAQLALQGYAAAGDAQTNYNNGVTNAIKWWGGDIPGGTTISDSDIDSYVNTLTTPTLNDVYNEQYLASFFQPVLAWNVYRINKVPVLSEPPNSTIGTVLRRFGYPTDEIATNPNTPINKLTSAPMWFEN